MDVAQWLNGIGLGQYEALFREHEIDADVLPDLTEADLEKIGVPLGHRKRLMRAIAALASNEAPPLAPILPRAAGEGDRPKGGGGGERRAAEEGLAPSTMLRMVPLPRFTGEKRADFAERRPITVMFCDLVGSTSLAARLDAEDWRNLVNSYLDEASAAVTALSGHVLKKLGDGLMALFGYPHAQENDAERAVRAALAIQRALADLNVRTAKTGAPALEARIGLDMGPVVVDAAGEVFGEAPNVAARVQAAAEPGTVLVTTAVQRHSMMHAELRLARETAEAFRQAADNEGLTTEAAVARRCLAYTRLWQGDFTEAQANLAQALRIYDPERDPETRFRFGLDFRVTTTAYLALTNWHLGEVAGVRELIEEAVAGAVESAHVPTQANMHNNQAIFEILRGDAEAVRRIADTLAELSQQHGIALFLAFGSVYSSWARARLGDRATGVSDLRQVLARYADQGNKLFSPFYQGLLAEVEAEEQDPGGALARIDEALALGRPTGERWTDAFLHRIRGDLLLRADPEHSAPAEESYRAAIAIAQEQGARSFGLRAALSLAKLCQSTGRPVEAHDALAPALEGFAPTPEMPEIAEAQALLERLTSCKRGAV